MQGTANQVFLQAIFDTDEVLPGSLNQKLAERKEGAGSRFISNVNRARLYDCHWEHYRGGQSYQISLPKFGLVTRDLNGIVDTMSLHDLDDQAVLLVSDCGKPETKELYLVAEDREAMEPSDFVVVVLEPKDNGKTVISTIFIGEPVPLRLMSVVAGGDLKNGDRIRVIDALARGMMYCKLGSGGKATTSETSVDPIPGTVGIVGPIHMINRVPVAGQSLGALALGSVEAQKMMTLDASQGQTPDTLDKPGVKDVTQPDSER